MQRSKTIKQIMIHMIVPLSTERKTQKSQLRGVKRRANQLSLRLRSRAQHSSCVIQRCACAQASTSEAYDRRPPRH